MPIGKACWTCRGSVVRTRPPRPRGGGIGIVVAALLTMPASFYLLPDAWPGLVTLALALSHDRWSLLAGWWDDHRSLPVLPRLGIAVAGVGAVRDGLGRNGLVVVVASGADVRGSMEHQPAQFHGRHRWPAGPTGDLRRQRPGSAGMVSGPDRPWRLPRLAWRRQPWASGTTTGRRRGSSWGMWAAAPWGSC